jgi:N-acetylneuraminic acid mutarotase
MLSAAADKFALLSGQASAKTSQRTLTFAERVAYQRAIEDVYWRHRIWPKDRPDPKPSLDAVISQAQLESKVAEYLRNLQMLQDYSGHPITAEQLQGEMVRMATHTKQPELLRKLFDALGNDPFVIAEFLARPALAERLLSNRYNAGQMEPLKPSPATAEHRPASAMTVQSGVYTLPAISDTGDCVNNTWAATSIANAPAGRFGHTVVWTGTEMIVWGGGYDNTNLNTGGRYDPATDNWRTTSTTSAPYARSGHTAVWTGNEMIIWGGHGDNTGGRYNPTTNSWRPTSTTNAPSGRSGHTAVWTGSEMIAWGGVDPFGFALNTGGKYNPYMDSWTATTATNAPTARTFHTAVWTGSEMIVWGGYIQLPGYSTSFNTGGRYSPVADTWTATSTTNAPSARVQHTAVWTGSEMIVWGGARFSGAPPFNTGGRYHPGTNSWTATSTTNAPSARSRQTAVWTLSEMIIWGGSSTSGLTNTGGKYNADTGSWTAINTANAPAPRVDATAVWTGNQMIVWGGWETYPNGLNTGGRYCAPGPPEQLGNISTRAFVQTGDNVMIGGFIVQGTGPKRVIIRAIGPELGAPPYNIPNALANPTLELHNGAGTLIASNDNWPTTIIGGIITSNQVGAIRDSGRAPTDGRESAIIADLQPGNYTAIVRGVNNVTGVALVEVYDLSANSASILGNISTRSFVQTGDNVMIGGFIVQGMGAKKVIIRAIGPELGAPPYNIPDALANPRLELHNAAGAVIGSNDDWQHTIIGGVITQNQVADIQNSGHAPTDPSESAIIAELPSGNYTAIVRGVNDTAGVALVEVYDLD